MPSRNEASARVMVWLAAGRSGMIGLAARLMSEVRKSVDIQRWREAESWKDRRAAVSWPRVGAAAAPAAIVIGGLIFYFGTREGAYPPPEPSAQEIALRIATAKNAHRTPPPGLAAVNQPIKPE